MTDRSGASSAVIGNYVYVLGGFHKGEELSSVERASINADGTIGTFGTVTDASLVTPREFHTSAVVGNYLFVLGGDDGTSPIETIERAPINADNSLGGFATISTTSLLIPRNLATVTLVGTSFCAIGGEDTSKAIVKSVEQATVSNDCSMGTFATVSGVALETALSPHHHDRRQLRLRRGVSLIRSRRHHTRGGYDGKDGCERRPREASAANFYG